MTALLAVQGPAARDILQPLTPLSLGDLKRFGCAPAEVAGIECLVARTGYTGEDGFELFTQGERTLDRSQVPSATSAYVASSAAKLLGL